MRLIVIFILASVVFMSIKTTPTLTDTGGSPGWQVVSAEVQDLMLTVGFSDNFTLVAELTKEQEEDCLFPGKLELDVDSEVFVSGCSPEDQIAVQIQSKDFGDWFFTVGRDGQIIPASAGEAHEEITIESLDSTVEITIDSLDSPEVVPASNNLVRRAADYEFLEIESEDLNLLPGLEFEFDLSEEPVPQSVELQLNLYLDPAFRRKHGSRARSIAKQIAGQAAQLMKHHSLDTKIHLVLGNRIYNSYIHLAFDNKTTASKDILTTLPRLLRAPFDIGTNPVAHVYLTVPDKGFINGVAIGRHMCSPKSSRQGRPRAIITWNKDVPTTAVTMAHEVGHILGMYHDHSSKDDRSIETCGVLWQGRYILSYGNSPRRTLWSECSNDDFRSYYFKIKFGSDYKYCLKETGIRQIGCNSAQFQCKSGLCISIQQRCDFTTQDCPDGDDETNCPFVPAKPACKSIEFQCGVGGRCIPSWWRCDGVRRHCPRGEDEIGCPFRF